MDHYSLGIDEWITLLGSLGWIFSLGLELVVQDDPLAS